MYAHSDDDRVVEIGEDEVPVLPDEARDDTEPRDTNDDRLWDDRPPHWS